MNGGSKMCSIKKEGVCMGKAQYLNYIAIDVLDKMGVDEPTQNDINYAESLLAELKKRFKISLYPAIKIKIE